MIRAKNDKGKKIAYTILGTPANIASKQTPKEEKIAQKVFHSSTSIIR